MASYASFNARRCNRVTGLVAAITAGLLAGACSSGGALDSVEGLLGSSAQTAQGADSDSGSGNRAAPQGELEKALAYWGEEHKKKPADLKIAIAYAKNLKAAGHKDQAFGVLQGASLIHGDSKELAGEMGRLALEYDQVAMAEKLLAMAEDPVKPDWRITSARGTALAKQNKYAEAIPVFERALAMSPNRPSIMNNLAMAHAANGDPATAESILRKASASSNDPKIKQNLALVLGLQGRHEEAGVARSGAAASATATADTDYIKRMVKATPATTPAAAMPAIAKSAPAAAQPNARLIEAKATGKAKRPAANDLRPAGGPSDVAAPTGSWATSVSR